MKIVSVQEAVAQIPDGAAVASSGFIGSAIAEYVYKAIEASYLAAGHPRDLTLIWGAALGDGSGRGIDHLGHEGLVARVFSAHLNLVPKLQALVDTAKVPGYIYPLGTMVQLYRECGAGRPGLITKIGLGTYVDPRISGAKANVISHEDVVEVVTIGGEEYIHYLPVPMNVGIIRATTADMKGNLSFEREATLPDALVIAQNVKRNGGIVIAEVEDVCEAGSINPRDVVVPGFMVDYVVVEPVEERHMYLAKPEYNPALAQKVRVSLDAMEKMPMDARKIIARRGAKELRPGQIVNLGLGMPEGVANVVEEVGCSDKLILTVESGYTGGTPVGGQLFGGCYNADYNVNIVSQMDWYDGGALDIAFLGAAEVDCHGNANVTKFNGRTVGPGGFINIAHTAKKVCFCGTLTAGGLKLAAADGRLTIVNEGKYKKFVKEVEQISFSGIAAASGSQKILYITERAVFELTANGPVLKEVAPGLDLQTQILDLIDFKIEVSPDLKEMDADIFEAETMLLPLLQA